MSSITSSEWPSLSKPRTCFFRIAEQLSPAIHQPRKCISSWFQKLNLDAFAWKLGVNSRNFMSRARTKEWNCSFSAPGNSPRIHDWATIFLFVQSHCCRRFRARQVLRDGIQWTAISNEEKSFATLSTCPFGYCTKTESVQPNLLFGPQKQASSAV